jgi:hypothetical protein
MRSRRQVLSIAQNVGFAAIASLCLFALSIWAFGTASLTEALVGVAVIVAFGVPGVLLGARIGLRIFGTNLDEDEPKPPSQAI